MGYFNLFLTLHQYLEVLKRGPGILHHNVPEGDRVAALALALPPHVEQVATTPVVPVSPGSGHG